MPRPHCTYEPNLPYNIGARAINRDWFSIPMPQVWEVMCSHLYFVHHAFNVDILAFVLMSNHFHLLARTPDANLPQAMRWFMLETSRELVRRGNRINQTYGGPHYRSLLRSPVHYLHAYKYLYYNPVKAGICKSVLDYPYSTLSGLLGRTRLAVPIAEDAILFTDVTGTLNWLDTPPKEEDWQAVRKALRKKEFKLAEKNRKPHPLESDAL